MGQVQPGLAACGTATATAAARGWDPGAGGRSGRTGRRLQRPFTREQREHRAASAEKERAALPRAVPLPRPELTTLPKRVLRSYPDKQDKEKVSVQTIAPSLKSNI